MMFIDDGGNNDNQWYMIGMIVAMMMVEMMTG